MTDSPQRVIIERIEPRTWNLRLRDNNTDQIHEVELRGDGPWSVELNGKAEVTSESRARAQVAPPPDDAITLRLDRSAGSVRIAAVGRGAKAWAGKQGTLLGSKWFHDDKGAPVVLVDDRPTLVAELRAALPEVTLDLAKYGPADSGAPAEQTGVAPRNEDITIRLDPVDDGADVIISVYMGEGKKAVALAWTKAHAVLLGKSWKLDNKVPWMKVRNAPSLVDDIKREVPGVNIELGNTHPRSSTPGPKKGGRGFAGKIDSPPDIDITLALTNIGRADDRVSVVATGREGLDAAALRAWTEQRAASLGPWQPLGDTLVALVRDYPTLPEDLAAMFPGIRLDVGMYQRPGMPVPRGNSPVAPEDMVFPRVDGPHNSEEPGALRILHEQIRRLSEVFIVVPLSRGYKFRSVELRTDRATGVYDGLPIGTPLLIVTLHSGEDPTILAKDWAPLQKTLRQLNRPAKQLGILREYVTEVVKTIAAAARALPDQPTSEELPAPAPSGKARTRKKAAPAAGPGPGDLSWERIVDKGTEGLAARWGEGQFKLLHVGAERYGLFYERDGGGFETLSCGTLEAGKQAAGERVAGTRAAVPLDARVAQVACATERRTGRPSNDEITLHVRRSDNARAVLVIQASGDRVHEWVFGHRSVLGREWDRGEDDLPEARIHDSPTIVADLRKEFPGVNIDTSAYKKLKRESSTPSAESPEPAAEAAPSDVSPPEETASANVPSEPEPPPEAAPVPATSPIPDQASQDAELLRSIKGQLADMLDEED